VYLTQRQLSRRIRLFVDYLVDCMGGEESAAGDA
jgi:hypothetical protein